MPDVGHTWRMPFLGLPDQARHVRTWVRQRLAEHAADAGIEVDPDRIADLILIADELFVAVMSSMPAKVEMTVSTSGDRVRVYAAGPTPLPLRARSGAGIVRGLTPVRGSQDGDRTIWAEVRLDGGALTTSHTDQE